MVPPLVNVMEEPTRGSTAARDDRRLRVLHVIQNLNYGGMERLLADIARLASPADVETHILALQYLGRFSEGLADCATLHLAEPMSRASMIWPRALIRQIRRIDPDVVHTHSGVWYKVTLAARAAGVPRLVHTEHGRGLPDPWLHRQLDRRAARRTDIVVAVSQALARQLAATIVRDGERIRVIENGVRTDLFAPRSDGGALRAELGISPDTPIIGSIGRLESIKGYEVMVEAMARLRVRASSPPPVLVVAGDGSERPRLQAMAESLGVGGSIRFLGWRDGMAELHEAFTVFTMSSHSEGTSVSLLEAMSAGLCPVVTDVGGNAEVLGPALRHRLVPPAASDLLATAWASALSDADRRRADGRAARARVIERFDASAMTRAYERLYHGGEHA